MEAGRALGFIVRPLRLGLSDLQKLTHPAILHWQFDHYVVLDPKPYASGFRVYDPALGRRTYTKQEISEYFTGVALELYPAPDFEGRDNDQGLSLSLFWHGTPGLIRSFVLLILLSLLLQVLALGFPFLTQIIIDDVLIKAETSILIPLALGFGMLVVFRSLTVGLRGYANLYLVNRFAYNIGTTVLGHIFRLPVEYFAKREIGDILSRFGSLQPIYNFLTGRTIAILLDGFLSIITLALMMAYSMTLTAIVLVAVILYLGVRVLQLRGLRESTQEMLIAEGKLDSSLIESIRNIRDLRLGNREVEAHSTSSSHLQDSLNARAKFEKYVVWYDVAQSLFPGIEQIVVISVAASLIVSEGAMTIGMLYAFLAFRLAFSNAALATVDNFFEYALVRVHLERVADILDVELDKGFDEPASALILPIGGDLEVQDITFSYGDTEASVLSGVRVVVREGHFLALVGPSGVGKSTLLLIMMGLLEPKSGRVTFGGWNQDAIGARSFREGMAAVSDGDVLVSGSVTENIAFRAERLDASRVEWAARVAEIHDDVLALPMGYRSLVGNGGLSAGQRQRVLIARALYRKPKILFLDEGTAHLDADVEQRVFRNLRNVGISCVYATHNLELLRFADDVVFWKHGCPKQMRAQDWNAMEGLND